MSVNSPPNIDVLLPTYNGEQFLPLLLHSVLNQEGVPVTLRVRDDNSTDATQKILRAFAADHAGMSIYFGPRLGVIGNVNALMQSSEAESNTKYFALADQDDVWQPHKLRIQYAAMRQLESRFGNDVPLLVCSDARCIDAKGSETSPSFLRLLGIPPAWGEDIRQVLVMSYALGCSCLGNEALRRMAIPLPKEESIFMHDWWLLLIATCFGAARCLNEPLLDYRQHTQNALGARGKGSLPAKIIKTKKNARRTQIQALTFLKRMGAGLTQIQRHHVSSWAHMPESPRLWRLWLCWRQGFGKPGLRWFIT